MADYVQPDRMYRIPIIDGELHVSPSYDILHRFEPLGAWVLKYWNVDHDPPQFSNVPMSNEAALFLIEECGIQVCYRTFIGTEEHKHLLDWQTGQIDDSWLA